MWCVASGLIAMARVSNQVHIIYIYIYYKNHQSTIDCELARRDDCIFRYVHLTLLRYSENMRSCGRSNRCTAIGNSLTRR